MAIDGLSTPTNVEFARDGRVFVAEKSGIVKVFSGLGDTSATVVANLRTNVYNYNDRGLLGMAVDPAFPDRPYLYVLYAHDAAIGGVAPRWGQAPGAPDGEDRCPTPPGPTDDGCVVSGRLSRLTIAGDRMTAEKVLVEDWCQQFPSHSVGDIAFGPDGSLYASGGEGAHFNFADYGQEGSPVNPCGDPPGGRGTSLTPPSAQGGALRAQDLQTSGDPVGLSGSVIRVDPDTGAGLAGNPFAGATDANARRIVAYGMRNPFRITMRPGTNEVWVADVGSKRYEKINRIAAPTDASVDNFGWPCFQSSRTQAIHQTSFDNLNLDVCERLYDGRGGAVRLPHFAYAHGAKVVNETCDPGTSSVTGVAFYNGGAYPAAYDGALFFADFSRSCAWVMFPDANGVPDPNRVEPFLAPASNIIEMEMGPAGDLFYVDIAGSIRRVTYASGNVAPTARLSATPADGEAPLTVHLSASASSDPEGTALVRAWDLDGDGQFDDSTAVEIDRTYPAGTYTVSLRVTDAGGLSDTAAVTIRSGNSRPVPTIATPGRDFTWEVGETVSFSGSATDRQDLAIAGSSLT